MTNNSSPRWQRRLIAVVDGVSFAWFIFISLHAALMLTKVSEHLWAMPAFKLPRLTTFAIDVLPEEAWSVVSGVVCFGIGFGLISLNSKESPTSRLFRWMTIALVTLIVAVALPAMGAFMTLSGGPSEPLSPDEFLFFGMALITLIYGVMQVLRHSRNRRA